MVGVCRAEKEEEATEEEALVEGAEVTETAEAAEAAEKPETHLNCIAGIEVVDPFKSPAAVVSAEIDACVVKQVGHHLR